MTGAVALVTGAVSLGIRRTFESIDSGRRAAALDRFQQELAAQGDDVVRKVQRAAALAAVQRIAIEANRQTPDFSLFVNDAQPIAEGLGLDYLDIVDDKGVIISSAHWPARFNYEHGWLLAAGDGSFLTRVPAQESPVLALGAARSVSAAAGKRIQLLAGRRLDSTLLAALQGAPGVRTILWRSEGDVINAGGPVKDSAKLAPLVAEVHRTRKEARGNVQWTTDSTSTESLFALPLANRDALLAVLLVATSLRDQIRLERSILWIGLGVGGAGILLGILLGWWTTARLTRPVAQLVSGARAVAAGDWSARVPVSSSDEIGELASAFNHMTEQLIEQRDRAVQAERVAAWRELARRLAHELKNPLFPLQITVENLRKARAMNSPEFDEIFRESTATLLSQFENLKMITARFSDFAKMPAPHVEPTDLNDVVRATMQLFEPQLQGHITPQVSLAEPDAKLEADPEQLRRVLSNLVLNAMDAMPQGGVLRVTTERLADQIRLTVSDTGQGLTQEECGRLFTPYYTTKHHGTGLGLAIVQSVVSDHHGRINVVSEPERGASFVIHLPLRRDA